MMRLSVKTREFIPSSIPLSHYHLSPLTTTFRSFFSPLYLALLDDLRPRTTLSRMLLRYYFPSFPFIISSSLLPII
jgi:hypothetical protein